MSQINTPASNADESTVSFGVIVAATSAISFGIATTIAKVSYDGGANAITFAIARGLCMSVVAVLLIMLLKREWRVPKSARKYLACIVIGQVCISIGILSSVQFIPVSLALLIMYVNPSLILIVESMLFRQLPSKLRMLSCVVAFAGLSLVLGFTFNGLDWRGIAFAMMACMGIVLSTMSMRFARQQINEVATTFWGNVAGLPIMIACVPLMGGLALPQTDMSWMAMAAGSFLFVVAFSCYAISMGHIKASRAAIIFNFEPLAALLSAALLLGERLSTMQLSGAVLIFAAVLLASR